MGWGGGRDMRFPGGRILVDFGTFFFLVASIVYNKSVTLIGEAGAGKPTLARISASGL